MSAQEMTALMDGLAAEARASRDRTFNTMHAVDRESRRATQRLAEQVNRFVGVHERSMAQLLRMEVPRLRAEQAAAAEREEAVPPAKERDTRFDPEDEWAPEPTPPQPVAAQTPTSGRRFDHDDEEYPETWLR